jgi:hypothetical protein
MNTSAQQQMTSDPEVIKQQVIQVIQQTGMPLDVLIELGQLAEAALNDPSGAAYKKYVDYMVSRGMERAEDMKKPDFQMMGMLIAMGKVAEEMGPQGPVVPQG